MPNPPETVSEHASPTEIMARLELLKERYRTGLMDAAAFNDVIKAFQFTDDVGHLWAPGVNSNKWYRWDRTEWTAADPPARMNLPGMPIMFSREGAEPLSPPPAPAAGARPTQPAAASQTSAQPSGKGRRAATKASTPSPAAPVPPRPVPPPPPVTPPPVAPAPARPVPAAPAPAAVQASGPKFCPQCGAPAAGKKFCSKCGRKLA